MILIDLMNTKWHSLTLIDTDEKGQHIDWDQTGWDYKKPWAYFSRTCIWFQH